MCGLKLYHEVLSQYLPQFNESGLASPCRVPCAVDQHVNNHASDNKNVSTITECKTLTIRLYEDHLFPKNEKRVRKEITGGLMVVQTELRIQTKGVLVIKSPHQRRRWATRGERNGGRMKGFCVCVCVLWTVGARIRKTL